MKNVVIEDRQLVRDMFIASCGSILPSAVVSDASNGAEGMKLCSQVQPDLVFLDLVLPDGDGIDLVATILSAAPQARVIALTSHSDEFTIAGILISGPGWV